MQSFRFYVAGAAIFSVSLVGCAQGEGLCPRPVGSFHGSWTIAGGTCARFVGRDLMFREDSPLSSTIHTNALDGKVSTEVNLNGCSIGVKQWISDPQTTALMSQLQGDLSVEDESVLSGQLNYVEYMPDGTTERCRALVNASYTTERQGQVGAAATQALAVP
ncbi:MAG: hypothetical protein ABW321_15545 [Polyangiales bacterium]